MQFFIFVFDAMHQNKYKSFDVRDLRLYINFDVPHQSQYIIMDTQYNFLNN